MNDTSIDLALIGRLVRARKLLLLILVVLGAVLGAASSLVLSPGYVSTSEVLLQGDLSTSALHGETQIATSLVVLDHTAEDLGPGVTGRQLQSRVGAAIADGNVMAISGSAPTPQAAQQLTDKATTEYLKFTNQIVADAANAAATSTEKSRSDLEQKIDEANRQITALQSSPTISTPGADGDKARADLQQQQHALDDTQQQLEKINGAKDSASVSASLGGFGARIIQQADLPAGQGSPTLVQLVLGGAAVLAVLGVLGHLIALRSDRHLRRAQDMAAAFGAPVLGVVGAAGRQESRSLIHRILHDDRRWAHSGLSVIDDERSRLARYQRVLRRATSFDGPAEILAIVLDDDPVGLGALVELAAAAAGGPVRAAAVTNDEALIQRMHNAADERGVGSQLDVGPDRPTPGSALTIVVARVSAEQPSIPDDIATDGALLIVGSGTRTAFELAGISAACDEASQPILGLVAAVPNAEGVGTAADATPFGATDPTMVGSA